MAKKISIAEFNAMREAIKDSVRDENEKLNTMPLAKLLRLNKKFGNALLFSNVPEMTDARAILRGEIFRRASWGRLN